MGTELSLIGELKKKKKDNTKGYLAEDKIKQNCESYLNLELEFWNVLEDNE